MTHGSPWVILADNSVRAGNRNDTKGRTTTTDERVNAIDNTVSLKDTIPGPKAYRDNRGI